MRCPYNIKSSTETQVWNQDYDSESEHERITNGKSVTKTQHEMYNCVKEDCGAWHNGKCCYKK